MCSSDLVQMSRLARLQISKTSVESPIHADETAIRCGDAFRLLTNQCPDVEDGLRIRGLSSALGRFTVILRLHRPLRRGGYVHFHSEAPPPPAKMS